MNLAITYSRAAYRSTTIGKDMFHFRVRDGNGWFHVSGSPECQPRGERLRVGPQLPVSLMTPSNYQRLLPVGTMPTNKNRSKNKLFPGNYRLNGETDFLYFMRDI